MNFKLWLENNNTKIVSYNNYGEIIILIGDIKYKYQTNNSGLVENLFRMYSKLGYLPWKEINKLKKYPMTNLSLF